MAERYFQPNTTITMILDYGYGPIPTNDVSKKYEWGIRLKICAVEIKPVRMCMWRFNCDTTRRENICDTNKYFYKSNPESFYNLIKYVSIDPQFVTDTFLEKELDVDKKIQFFKIIRFVDDGGDDDGISFVEAIIDFCKKHPEYCSCAMKIIEKSKYPQKYLD